MRKRTYSMGLLIILAIVLFYCASVQEEADVAEKLALNATSGQLRTMGSLIQTEEVTELLKAATERVIWAESQAEINLQYMPEIGYRETIEGGGMDRHTWTSRLLSSYAYWKGWLIIGENLYQEENGIYKKVGDEYVKEMFHDSILAAIRQYNNFLITVGDDCFLVFDLDAGEKTDISDWDEIIICDWVDWYIFDGKIYYISDNHQSIHRIDLFSGRDETVYSLDETVFPCHMIYSFGIRDDGSIMAAVRSVYRNKRGEPMYDLDEEYSLARRGEYHSQHIEFWMISPNEEGTAEQKVWETDIYSTVDSVDFNRQGFFFEGNFATWEDRIEHEGEYGGVIWIKEDGGMQQVYFANRCGGFYLTENGYYLVDSIEDPESMKWYPGVRNEYVFHVDAVTKYDFEGNELGTYRLVDEEALEEGWYLLDLICYNDEITAFYAKESTDELYIRQIRVE